MANALLPILLIASLPGVFLLPVASAAAPQQSASAAAATGPAPAKLAIPKTLKEALEKAAWDPASRGPLLIVAPEVSISKPLWSVRYEEMRKKGANSAELTPPFPLPASNGEYRVPELAEFYGRRLVRLNGVTVLAPETMIVLNDNPGKPDIYAGMQQDQKLQMFQATLTEAQWARLGSDSGLGIGDLQGDQRDLFLSLLPDPFTVMRGTAMANGGMRFGGENQPEKLAGNERLGIRLRLARTIQMGLVQQGGSRVSTYVSGRQEGQEVLQLNTWETTQPQDETLGQKLRDTVPTRLKPQQIDFDSVALNPRVSLNGVKTVGDLVDRIRAATRLELYVDPRLGKQPVLLRTTDDTALRAGELLKSLCWGIAGAVRYLEEGRIFILTDDITGWGTRVGRIQTWVSMGEQLRQQQLQKFAAEIRKRNPVQYLKFDEKDPMAVKPERMAEIEKKWSTFQGRYQGVSVPLEKLTPEQQVLAKSTASAHNTQVAAQQVQSEYYRPVDASSVTMTMRVRLLFSVPGVGEVEDPNSSWSMLDNMLPAPDRASLTADNPAASKKTISLPLRSALGGVLKVAPKDAAQAKMVVQAARERGFRQVWITVPSARLETNTSTATESTVGPLPDYDVAAREGQAILTAAIEEAKTDAKKPLLVVAVVSVLTAVPSAGAPAGASLDRNVLGETSSVATLRQASITAASGQEKYAGYIAKNAKEWLVPDAPGLLPRLKKYLLAVAAVPGLAGLTLTDTAASGYETSGPNNQLYYSDSNLQMGYIPAYRADFVRTAGYDPVDLAPVTYSSMDLSHPLLGSSTPTYGNDGRPIADDRVAVGGRWNQARFARATELMASLYAALSTEKKLLQKLPANGTTPPGGGSAPLDGQFALYIRAPRDAYGSYILWDSKDTLKKDGPTLTYDSDYAQVSYNAVRAASSRCLFCYTYIDRDLFQTPDSPKTPRTPAERSQSFAQSYNETLSYRKGIWDGVIVDLGQTDVESTLPLLSVVTVEAPPSPSVKPRRTLR